MKMSNIKFLMLFSVPALVFGCFFEIEKDTKICDDGNEIWTVGYGNRSLQALIYRHNCTLFYFWCQGYSKCKSKTVLIGDPRQNFSQAYWIDNSSTPVITKIDFSDAVEMGENVYYSIRHVTNSSEPSYWWNISRKYCPTNIAERLEVETETDVIRNRYNTKGNFTCLEGSVLVNTANNTIVSDPSTTCGTCAKWKHMERMRCWEFPKVTLKTNYGNCCRKTFVAGENLTADMCNITYNGEPNASVFLFWNNSKRFFPFTLSPYYHNTSVYCKAENNLTELNNTLIRSDAFLLDVEFGPTEVENYTTCNEANKEPGLFNMTLDISFSANPPLGNVTLSVLENTVNSTTKLSDGSIGCCGVPIQRYRIVVANVTSQDSITFLYEHKIKNYSHNFSCADAIKKRPVVTTPVIIAVSGGILLIIAIVILCVLIKRRRKLGAAQSEPSQPPSPEGQGSEERLSVLYDTTDIRSSGNVGESVENVLYDSASGTTDVYAAVVKPKNKENSGETVENVLYGSATRETDVYAAVVKPKKKSDAKPTDLYAEVVKIKKKKKDSNADDPSVSEATYAAVNKKQKSEKSGKQHKEVDESLQLDQTYAVVDKNGKKK